MNQQINVKLILYSECKITNKKIATFVLRIPKFIIPHLNSHRSLSRNSASSRAVPAKKMRERVMRSPFLPVYFGKNKKGMQSGEPLVGVRLFIAYKIWLWSRYFPIFFHFVGEKIRMHKEILNRIIEPWILTEVVITATEWNNFLKLRNNPDAQPEIQIVAKQINKLLCAEKPNILKAGEWHLPFVRVEENNLDLELKNRLVLLVVQE